jgi:hypothetical protein
MDHFSYHSEQIHSSFKNGKGQTRRNIVNIKNGEGIKAMETYSANGKLVKRKEKTLTASELGCIKRNEFIPGLFKDCGSKSKRPSKTRNNRKTGTRKAK